jgi:hypothetical protein
MKHRKYVRGTWLLVAALTPAVAVPCALVGTENTQVRIDAEEALIVWDAAHGVEHFVRRANFRGRSRQPFGFLVPTPTRPTLADADEGVFDRLANLYTIRRPARGRLRAAGDGADDMAGARVEVVEVTRVAGLDATVLRASDPNALAAWLAQHGFASRVGLATWLARYTTGDWHLTAFRYDGGARSAFGSRAVRLSFAAERPFYPYAEPGDQPQRGGRRLRVTVISNERVRGVVGDTPWAARTGYARQPDLARVLRGAVPSEVITAGAWMTTFEERSSRRGSMDLGFVRAVSQARIAPSIERYR